MPRKKDQPKETADEKEARLLAGPAKKEPIPPEHFLSTGCVLMNTAFSGHPDRGIPKGTSLRFIGDSGTSKTFACFTLFAEAAINPNFKDYRFVFDNAENGALMDVEKFFGSEVVKRLQPPRKDKEGNAVNSRTAQEFFYNIERNCRKGPCIYALDSIDALNDDADNEQFQKGMQADDGESVKVPGSMGMSKAKTFSRNINRTTQTLQESGSILVMISQTRDKVGGMVPNQKTASGGRANKFYAHLEIWTSVRATLKRTVNDKEREIGHTIKADVQKNRVCGWEGQFEFDFLKGYGVDDLATSVKFLCAEHWKDVGQKRFEATEFDFKGNAEAIVQKVRKEGLQDKLKHLTAEVWNRIVEESLPQRDRKYN